MPPSGAAAGTTSGAAAWCAAAGSLPGGQAGLPPGSPGDTAVVLAAAGSRRPAANAAVAGVAARWQAARGWRAVVPAYAAAGSPTPGEAVSALRRGGAPRVVVATYLLAPGRFADQVAESVAGRRAPRRSPRRSAPRPRWRGLLLLRYAAAVRRGPGGHGRAPGPADSRIEIGELPMTPAGPDDPRRPDEPGRPACHARGAEPGAAAGRADVADDPALLAALGREGAPWAAAELHELGILAGAAETQELARLANENPPVLRTPRLARPPDRRGRVPPGLARADDARPSAMACTPRRGRIRRPARTWPGRPRFYVWAQAEAGHGCPISHDLRRGARAAARAGPRRRVRAAAGRPGPTTRACACRTARPGCWPAWP